MERDKKGKWRRDSCERWMKDEGRSHEGNGSLALMSRDENFAVGKWGLLVNEKFLKWKIGEKLMIMGNIYHMVIKNCIDC